MIEHNNPQVNPDIIPAMNDPIEIPTVILLFSDEMNPT